MKLHFLQDPDTDELIESTLYYNVGEVVHIVHSRIAAAMLRSGAAMYPGLARHPQALLKRGISKALHKTSP